MVRQTTAGGNRRGRSGKVAKRAASRRQPQRKSSSLSELRKQLELRDEELKTVREQQSATANVLKVISQSAFELGSVLSDIARVAHELCAADDVTILTREGDNLRIAAHFGAIPMEIGLVRPINRDWVSGRAAVDKLPIQVRDLSAAGTDYPLGRQIAERFGHRTTLAVPLLKDDKSIGCILLRRLIVADFADKQVSVLQTFADQAVIAIENARLFGEVRDRTDDLGISLQQQTATSEVLKLISRSAFDLQTVLDALVESATRLCEASDTIIFLRHGNALRTKAHFGPIPVDFDEQAVGSGWVSGRAVLERRPIQVLDPLDSKSSFPDARMMAARLGFRTTLSVPLMQGDEAIGTITIRRTEVEAFSERQIELIKTFADQAVIAIENVRLINETREALERQTATSDILKIIASSPSDVQPVFDAIATSANKLIGGSSTAVMRLIGDELHLAAFTPTSPEADAALRAAFPGSISRFPQFERVVRDGRTIQFADTEAERVPLANRDLARLRGYRSMLFTPLMSSGSPIGLISVTRKETGSFADHHVQLVRTFADQAVIAIENTRRFNETKEALERQTATADVLKVIASSPSNLQPVFEAIAARSNQLIGGHSTAVYRFVDGVVHLVAFTPVNPEADSILQKSFPSPVSELTPFAMVFRGETVHQPDVLSAESLSMRTDTGVKMIKRLAAARGFRSCLFVPLISELGTVGMISVTRREVGPFAHRHIDLLKTFASQAVIAIQNVALFDEVQAKTRDLEESLQQQTATADVLKVISRSTFDLQTVLNTLTESASQLCEADRGVIFLRAGANFCLTSNYGYPAEFEAFARANPLPADGNSTTARAAVLGKPFQAQFGPDDPMSEYRRLGGFRSNLGVPLRQEGEVIGVFTLTRLEPIPFTERQIELVGTFADQAVIAIENTRLLRELRERTDDLTESLEQQTATSEVLSAISRTAFDLNKVLQTLVESAAKLSDSDSSTITRQDGGKFYRSEAYGFSQEFLEVIRKIPVEPDRGSVAGRALLEGRVAHVADVLEDPEYTFTKIVGLDQFRTTLGVPMMRDGSAIGVLTLTRNEPRPYTQKQIDIVTTFADQAAIAIENSRLFEEVKAKTRELTESLVHQAGSANILSVIASSPTDVRPVLNAIVESACEVCEAYDAVVALKDGDDLRFRAHKGPIPLAFERWPINRRWTAGRAFLDQKPVQVEDLSAESNAEFSDGRELSLSMGHRTTLSVPLLREGESIGAIALRRTEVNPFSEKQIALLQTFADQAVIAIGNVQLFEEVRQRTRELSETLEQQVATSEVLQVISSSPGELEPVFESMLANATRLCEAECGVMWLYEDNAFRSVALHGPLPPAYVEQWKNGTPAHPGPHSPLTVLAQTRSVVHIPDMREDRSFLDGDPLPVAAVEVAGIRTLLLLPMLKEDELVGGISIYRQEVRPFTDKQIELVSTFARQAVIAIENARLLSALRQRTDDLSQSLNELRSAQDRLVQTEKLASLGQLTAGIAHEIKNPLNFVNNFSSLSVELIDEMTEVLDGIATDPKKRHELNELTQTLRSNLEKIAQHGKRADSIVKNMLLHSREGAGEQQAVDINAIVDEGLNLAYHGARAERPGFNINLQRKFDPAAGHVEVYPQELTRVLLNIVSNGFYAANRRASEAIADFTPTLSAETRNLGNRVEIRIRDNGTGMPADVKARIFTPFFTTKPPGEGTGLGLSMSHDIIVKQHRGSIDVETEPGEYTEFVITLPR